MLPILLRRENTSRTFHYYRCNYYYRYNLLYIFFTSLDTLGRIFRLYRTTSRERGEDEDARENLATRVDRCTRDDCYTMFSVV